MATKIDEVRSAVEEMREYANQAQHPKVKNILSVELRKLETQLSALVSAEQAEDSKVASQKAGGQSGVVYTVKLTNYAWDQSEKFIKIFVNLKDVHSIPGENVTCTFEDRTMELLVRHLDGKNYHLTINNLLEKIDPQSSSWKVKRDSVLVLLVKASLGKEWSHVTAAEKRAADSRLPKKPSPSEDSDPSAGLMQIMKQMYQDGDDDMKRTIAKAWTESQDKKTNMDL